MKEHYYFIKQKSIEFDKIFEEKPNRFQSNSVATILNHRQSDIIIQQV